MKHHISITMDQKLYREIETIRGREKRSTFIEYLIKNGLKTYKKQKPNTQTPTLAIPTEKQEDPNHYSIKIT
ncbi:MAG: hypothetical protein NWF04_03690 [Candidatus Bathyarchaeota archaeon]|nr:hypothetical protein [Candidatus Bathyarchaeota archaeon]